MDTFPHDPDYHRRGSGLGYDEGWGLNYNRTPETKEEPQSDMTVYVRGPSPTNLAEQAAKPAIYQGVLAYFPRALVEVARTSEFGVNKYDATYADQDWKKVPIEAHVDASGRHIMRRAIDGDLNPEDAYQYHLAQGAWRLLAALEQTLIEEERTDDDLPA